jgi:HEAT repeat protein
VVGNFIPILRSWSPYMWQVNQDVHQDSFAHFLLLLFVTAGVTTLTACGDSATSPNGSKAPSSSDSAKHSSTFQGENVVHWKRSLTDRDPAYRLRATKAIEALGDEAAGATNALIITLKDEQPAIRAGAAQALAAIGKPAASAEMALKETLNDDNALVRVSAIMALGQITGTPSVGPMIEALRDDDEQVKDVASRLIVKVGQPAIKEISPLLTDPDTKIRIKVVNMLGSIGHIEALASLQSALDAREREIRDAAIIALGQLGKAAIPALKEQLADLNWNKRWSGVYSLRLIGGKEAAAAIVRALNDKDERVSAEAIDALSAIGPAAVDALSNASTQEDADIRFAAISALAGMAKEQIIPVLQTALADKVQRIREAAVMGLAATKSQKAIPALSQALRSDNVQASGDAMQGLVQLGDASVSAFAQAIKEDKRWAVRRVAAQGLGHIATVACVPSLNRALRDEDERVRIVAARSLTQVGPIASQAISPLVFALEDQSDDVRNSAALAIARIAPGNPTAVPAIVRALKHSNPRVRVGAAQAIAWLGSEAPSAVYGLIGLLKDKDDTVVLATRLALIKLNKEALAGLQKALQSESSDAELRLHVIDVLGQIGIDSAPAAEKLVSLLLDKNERIRESAMHALSLIGIPGRAALVKASRGNDKTLAAAADVALEVILKQK